MNHVDRDILAALKQSMNEKPDKSLVAKTCKNDRDFEFTIKKLDKRSLDLMDAVKINQEKVQEAVQGCQDVYTKIDSVGRSLTKSLVNVQALDHDGEETIAQRDEKIRWLNGYRADYFA